MFAKNPLLYEKSAKSYELEPAERLIAAVEKKKIISTRLICTFTSRQTYSAAG